MGGEGTGWRGSGGEEHGLGGRARAGEARAPLG